MATFTLKENTNYEDLAQMTPKLLIAFGWLNYFADARGLDIQVTNVLEKFSVSVSDSHPQGRAVDFSTKGWTLEDREAIELQMRLQCDDIAAISKRTGEPRILYFHDAGLGAHGHLQVSP